MDRLKNLLMEAEINFTENAFNTEDSIEGLGQEPFVSTFWCFDVRTLQHLCGQPLPL